jgi:hypothetical protein
LARQPARHRELSLNSADVRLYGLYIANIYIVRLLTDVLYCLLAMLLLSSTATQGNASARIRIASNVLDAAMMCVCVCVRARRRRRRCDRHKTIVRYSLGRLRLSRSTAASQSELRICPDIVRLEKAESADAVELREGDICLALLQQQLCHENGPQSARQVMLV